MARPAATQAALSTTPAYTGRQQQVHVVQRKQLCITRHVGAGVRVGKAPDCRKRGILGKTKRVGESHSNVYGIVQSNVPVAFAIACRVGCRP